MHALEAKTCENRRFRGRFQKNLVVWKLLKRLKDSIKIFLVSEELSSVETCAYHTRCTSTCQFQKNLVVWKLLCKSLISTSLSAFQKNLVVWKHETMERWKAFGELVSEELSSVETRLEDGQANVVF